MIRHYRLEIIFLKSMSSSKLLFWIVAVSSTSCNNSVHLKNRIYDHADMRKNICSSCTWEVIWKSIEFGMSILNNKFWRTRLIFCSHFGCDVVIQSKANCNQAKAPYWTETGFRELKARAGMLRSNSTSVLLTEIFTASNVATSFKFDQVTWLCSANLKNCELVGQTPSPGDGSSASLRDCALVGKIPSLRRDSMPQRIDFWSFDGLIDSRSTSGTKRMEWKM